MMLTERHKMLSVKGKHAASLKAATF